MTSAVAGESPVAVFGGTFDPIHNGHLRSALELADKLSLADVRMMPCANPPHRTAPGVSAEHRAAMLELAVASDEHLSCDRRELNRTGRSYTIDSLIELRRESQPRPGSAGESNSAGWTEDLMLCGVLKGRAMPVQRRRCCYEFVQDEGIKFFPTYAAQGIVS